MGNSNSSQQLEEVAPANDTTNASAKATPIKHAPIASSQPIALPGSSNKNAAAMAKARLLIPESLVAGSPLVSEEGQSLGSGGRGHFRQRSTSSAGTPGASNTAGSALGQQMHGLALSNAPIQEVVSPGRVGKTAEQGAAFGSSAGRVTEGSVFPRLVKIESTQHGIPISLQWARPGKTVFVTGSFNGWKHKIPLKKSLDDFQTIIDMPVGVHHLKYVVDDEWKCSEDLPTTSDPDGNLVNYIEVTPEAGFTQGDGMDDLSLLHGSLTANGKETSYTPDQYSQEIPGYLDQDPTGATTVDLEMTPPPLPRYLEKVILNHRPGSNEDPGVLPVPNHVSLNHLYACSIRDNVMAVACTARYRQKYVTSIMYKPFTTESLSEAA